MAGPAVHIVTTLPIAVWAWLAYPLAGPINENILIQIFIWILGIFPDVDHLSAARIRKLLGGDVAPVEGHLDWFHTIPAMVVIFFTSLVFFNFLPLFAFALHMIIDGGEKTLLVYRGEKPLPRMIFNFYPEWAKYTSRPITYYLIKKLTTQGGKK